MIFEVENIKCGGCANSITQSLLAFDEINDVKIDVELGSITIHSNSESDELKNTIGSKLTAMGYPEKGSVEGLDSLKARATSYVSCAIGKMTEK